jgi:hypothetical protein
MKRKGETAAIASMTGRKAAASRRRRNSTIPGGNAGIG